MAKNPDNVKRFLYELLPQLQALWKKEEKAMLYLKEQEVSIQQLFYFLLI